MAHRTFAIKPISEEKVMPLLREMKKEGLTDFSHGTVFYGAWTDGQLVGVGGLVLYRRSCKIKSVYVVPAMRRQGCHRQMLDHLIGLAKQAGKEHINATVTAAALPEYLRRGAIVVRRYQKYTSVRLEQ